MPLPISLPYTFANATTAIPLAQLDTDLTTLRDGINGIGNGTNALANVSITGGTIAASNVTITGGTIANVTAVTVVANTATDAVRITQTGAGNALVVEDSSNPDASPFVVTAAGVAIVGDTTSRTIGGITTSLVQVSSVDNNGFSAGLSAIAWANAATDSLLAAPVVSLSRSASANTGTNTSVVANNALGSITFQGADGTGFIRGARIAAYVDGTPGTNDMPGRLVFSTTADGAADSTDRMTIKANGYVGINTSNPTQALSVNGGVGFNIPVTVTAATYTVDATDNFIIANRAGTVTLTLPAAASYAGRILFIKTVQAQAVASASSNVVPVTGTTAGTSILPATDGANVMLVSDGTNWITMLSS